MRSPEPTCSHCGRPATIHMMRVDLAGRRATRSVTHCCARCAKPLAAKKPAPTDLGTLKDQLERAVRPFRIVRLVRSALDSRLTAIVSSRCRDPAIMETVAERAYELGISGVWFANHYESAIKGLDARLTAMGVRTQSGVASVVQAGAMNFLELWSIGPRRLSALLRIPAARARIICDESKREFDTRIEEIRRRARERVRQRARRKTGGERKAHR